MNNRERLKLIIENWFVEKTSIKPTEEGLNNLVDRIYYDKQLNIYGVSQQRELLELVTEIANSNQVYSNTRHKLWAKKLISSNCG